MKVFRGFPKADNKLLFHYAVLRSATARSQGVAVPFFEYNEKRFHYETYGSDDAPSLILLMGLGMAGIFIVIIVLMAVLWGLTKIFPEKKDKGSK